MEILRRNSDARWADTVAQRKWDGSGGTAMQLLKLSFVIG
jgi:hypothetical protein